MSKRTNPQQNAEGATKADIEWLARIMKEGFEESEAHFRKEIQDSENRLRTEARESEERLQYRIAKVANDVMRHIGSDVGPKIEDHELRIAKLEHPARA